MSGTRAYPIGPLTNHAPVWGFTSNGCGAGDQKPLGQAPDPQVFPVSDRRLNSRSMMLPGPELVHTVKILWRDTIDPNSALNTRLRYPNLRFPFTGKPRADDGVANDPGRLSEVLQPSNVPHSSARQLAAAENAPVPTGAVMSSTFAEILSSLATPPHAPPTPAADQEVTPPTAIAAPVTPREAVAPSPKAPEEPALISVTKISEPDSTPNPPAPMEIDIPAAMPIANNAAILAAVPPSAAALLASIVEEASVPKSVEESAALSAAEDESSASSQAEEVAEGDESSTPSSSEDEDDVDDEEDDASHEQDDDESSDSEFVPRKKRSAGDGDAEAASGDSDASEGSDDDVSEGCDDSDSVSVDKGSEEYDEEADDEEEEEDDDDEEEDDEDQDSDDVPVAKSKKRKSAAASPPKKRTPPAKEASAEPTQVTPAAAPAPVAAVKPQAPAHAAKPATVTFAPNAVPYPLVTKLLSAKELECAGIHDSAGRQTLTAIYNIICLKNWDGIAPNPLREALQPGFQLATANKKQKQALEIHAIELASRDAEIAEVRATLLEQIAKHTELSDKMREVLRIICSEQYVVLESVPLAPKPGQRCELTNEVMRFKPEQNMVPRSCHLITMGPATITTFIAGDLTHGALNFFWHYFHMPHLAMAIKLDNPNPTEKDLAHRAASFYRDQCRFGHYVKEWATTGEFKKATFGINGISPGSDFSFHWQK